MRRPRKTLKRQVRKINWMMGLKKKVPLMPILNKAITSRKAALLPAAPP